VGATGATAFALRDPLPWKEFASVARTGEELGYRGVFLPEIAGRDAFAALTGLAAETEGLLLGTGVVPMTSRKARVTAMGAATVQERSGGRAILGVGTGPAGPGALDRLREYVAELRDARLSLDVGAPAPIWSAPLGPRALRAAGEIADGALLNWCPPERVTAARELIREGAEQAGRDPTSVTVAVYVRGNLGSDEAHAMEALSRATGEYASYPAYARQFDEVGLGAEAAAAAEAHRAGRPRDVPDELVRAICLVGDADAARARVEEFREAGADLPVVYPVASERDAIGSIMGTLFALAPHPAVEA